MEVKKVRWVRSPDQDQDGFTRMEGALNQPTADLSDRFCGYPFDYAEIHSGGRMFLCCPSWLPQTVGNLVEQELTDAFNSTAAQEVRRSILDGSFRYCHKQLCPLIQKGTLPKKAALRNSRHQQIVEESRVAGLEPVSLNLCYDDSCNLSCPSCRANAVFVTEGPEYDLRKAIQDKVIRSAFGEPHDRALTVTITGSGDPFGSKLFRELLFNLDGSRYPNLRLVLHTNGVAFTPYVWDKLWRVHGNIDIVKVSVDAGNEEQYRTTRRGGDWQTLMANLECLGRKRQEGAFPFLVLNLIVQRDNFTGIPEFIRLGNRIGADGCSLSLVTDWGTWTKEEFLARTVWSADHPQFDEFLAIMADPIVGDPIVRLGNTVQYRHEALARRPKASSHPIEKATSTATTTVPVAHVEAPSIQEDSRH